MPYLLTSSPLCLLYRNVHVAATKVHCGCWMRHPHCHKLTSHFVCMYVRALDWIRYRDFCVEVRFMKKAVRTYDVQLISDWHFAAAKASKLFIFRRVGKIAKNYYYLRHGCSPFLMEHIGSHWKDFYEISYLNSFSKICRENSNLVKILQE